MPDPRPSSDFPVGSEIVLTDCHGAARDRAVVQSHPGPYSLCVLAGGRRLHASTSLVVTDNDT